jgi:hypothetical protein
VVIVKNRAGHCTPGAQRDEGAFGLVLLCLFEQGPTGTVQNQLQKVQTVYQNWDEMSRIVSTSPASSLLQTRPHVALLRDLTPLSYFAYTFRTSILAISPFLLWLIHSDEAYIVSTLGAAASLVLFDFPRSGPIRIDLVLVSRQK